MYATEALVVACILFSCGSSLVRATCTRTPCQDLDEANCQNLKHIIYGASLLQKNIMEDQEISIEQRFLFTNNVTELGMVKSLIEIINEVESDSSNDDNIIMAANTSIKKTACKHLEDILSSWYEGFDCSTEQLGDIEIRIDAHAAITELRKELG